jgi:hypothetical protein
LEYVKTFKLLTNHGAFWVVCHLVWVCWPIFVQGHPVADGAELEHCGFRFDRKLALSDHFVLGL